MPWVEDPETGERTWRGRGNPYFGLVKSPGRPKRVKLDQLELSTSVVVETTIKQHLGRILENLIERATHQTRTVKCPACGHRHELRMPGDPDVGRYLIDRLVGKPVERKEEVHAVLVDTLRALVQDEAPDQLAQVERLALPTTST